MQEILASQLQADLKAIAQARIRATGVLTRNLTVSVYSSYMPPAIWGVNDMHAGVVAVLQKTIEYDFRNIVIDSIPAPTAAVKGELITPDSVFRMKNWIIGNILSKFKGVIGDVKLIDGRYSASTPPPPPPDPIQWSGNSIGWTGYGNLGLENSGMWSRLWWNNYGSLSGWISASPTGTWSAHMNSGGEVIYTSSNMWRIQNGAWVTFGADSNWTGDSNDGAFYTGELHTSSGLLQYTNASWGVYGAWVSLRYT